MSLLEQETFTPAPEFAAPITPARALEILKDGNHRFRNGLRSIESMPTQRRIRALAEDGQRPFATFVSCSDSRVPAEMIFDQGLGHLFMIRLAGNVVPTSAIASIEYAAMSFATPLIVVMGHTGCGAINAAVDAITKDGPPALTDSLGELIDHIAPSVHEAVAASARPEDVARRATVENIRRSVESVCERSAMLRGYVDAGRVAVVGALYDMHTGEVDFEITAGGGSDRVVKGVL